MNTVFLSGSIKIKTLDDNVKTRLGNIVKQKLKVLLGDAKGADLAFQEFFDESEYEEVTVYCVNQPRNKVRDWEISYIETSLRPGTRKYFTVKDEQMAEDCDMGFMLWDSKSQGTLKNVLELLSLGKKSLVYISKKKKFLTVKKVEDFEQLISHMHINDLESACEKLNVEKKLEAIENSSQAEVQTELSL